MSYLSVDNLIGVQPTTSSSTTIQASIVDVYNGTTNYHHITSASTAAPNNVVIPDADGEFVLTTGSQTIQSKMNHAQSGSQTDASYSFQSDTDTGMFRDAPNTIGFTTGGTKRLTIDASSVISVLPIQCENYKSNGGVGGAGNTIYGGLTNTLGMYFGLNRINFSTNSVERLNIQDTAITASQPVLHPNGTAANNGISFSSEVNTGMYISGTGLFFTKGGTNMMKFINSEVFSDKTHNFITGAASAPAIKGASYGTTGLFWEAGPQVSFSAGSTRVGGFTAGGLKLYGSTSGNSALYTPTVLGHYEDLSVNMVIDFGNVARTATIYLIRIGNMVILQSIVALTYTAPSSAQSSFSCAVGQAIPARFRPNYEINSVGSVVVAPTGSQDIWYISMLTNGQLFISNRTGATVGTGITLYTFSCSWIIQTLN